MQVIVAFILEAFVFRIQYRMVMHGHDMDGMSNDLRTCVRALILRQFRMLEFLINSREKVLKFISIM